MSDEQKCPEWSDAQKCPDCGAVHEWTATEQPGGSYGFSKSQARWVGYMLCKRICLERQLAQALVRERSLFESASYWKAEFVRLREIVDRLPKTADGVPVVQGDILFGVSEIDGRIVRLTADEPTLWTAIEDLPDEGVSDERVWDFCVNAYSTREAALAASEGQEGEKAKGSSP